MARLNAKITYHILTIFPRIMDSYFKESLFKRARASGLIEINTVNIRDFTTDKHHKVDDKPYGGGPGMVLKIEPIYQAVQSLKRKIKRKKEKVKTILFSTRGKKFDSKTAKRLAKYNHLILICGRYEGVDERVARYVADEEISLGDFILSGGELAAMIVAEAVSRFIPGFLGKQESLEEYKGSYPTYTRPEIFITKTGKKLPVPKTLLSGDPKKIDEWRKKHVH